MIEECYLILHFASLGKGRATQIFRAALQGCLGASGLMTNQKQPKPPLPLLLPKHSALARLRADIVTSGKLLWEEALVISRQLAQRWKKGYKEQWDHSSSCLTPYHLKNRQYC